MSAIEAKQERSARRRWLGLIVAFFGVQAVLWAAAITFVSNDPSHAVLPNYSERALAWDREMEDLRRSDSLGWKASTELGPVDRTRPSPIVVRLVDRRGSSIDGAEVTASLFHQSRAGERQQITFHSDGDGTYRSAASIARAGRWRIELRASRGDERFRVDQVHTVGEAG